MRITDLIADLRSRINPAYARTIGTESYERRMCVEAMESQQAEIERLRQYIGATLSKAGAGHIYAGSCPDEFQPDSRDDECPACRLLAHSAKRRAGGDSDA